MEGRRLVTSTLISVIACFVGHGLCQAQDQSVLKPWDQATMNKVTADFADVHLGMTVAQAEQKLLAGGYKAELLSGPIARCGTELFEQIPVFSCDVKDLAFVRQAAGTTYKVTLHPTITLTDRLPIVKDKAMVWAITAAVQSSDPRVGNVPYLQGLAEQRYPDLAPNSQPGQCARDLFKSYVDASDEYAIRLNDLGEKEDDCRKFDFFPSGVYAIITQPPEAVALYLVIVNHDMKDLLSWKVYGHSMRNYTPPPPPPPPVKPSF